MSEELKEKLDRLEQIRKAKGMTQEKFAKKELEVTRQAYWNWLKGERKPNFQNTLKIIDYLEG